MNLQPKLKERAMTDREASLILIGALAKSIEAKEPEIAEALREIWRRFSKPTRLQ